jgi:hypothetical protein
MGKVLLQCGQSEEARAAARSGISGKLLVLPRSNVPEELKPAEEKPEAAEKADDQAASKPEVCTPCIFISGHHRNCQAAKLAVLEESRGIHLQSPEAAEQVLLPTHKCDSC